MFLEFTQGHWVSLYKNQIAEAENEQLPLEIEMRVMTSESRVDVEFTDDVPTHKKHPLKFMWKLIAAWAAMGFKSPKIAFAGEKLDGQ